MHELLMAQGILEAALSEAEKVGSRRILQICARVREPSHHSEDASALHFCLEAVAKGTIAEGAEMTIEMVPAVLSCRQCGHTFEAEGGAFLCPRCGAGALHEVDAEEICLDRVVVE